MEARNTKRKIEMDNFFSEQDNKERKERAPTQLEVHNDRVSNVYFGNVLDKELASGAGIHMRDFLPHHVDLFINSW